MRLLMDVRAIKSGVHGIGRYIAELLKGFSQAPALDLALIVSPDLTLSPWISREIECLSIRVPPYSPREYLTVPRIARRWRPDVLFVPSVNAPLRCAAPVAMTVQDLLYLRLPRLFSWKRWAYVAHLVKQACRNASTILTSSQTSAHDLIQFFGIDASRIHVVPLGVDDRFTPAAAESSEMARPYILYIGDDRPHKNVALALKVFAGLKTRHRIPHRLVLAGPLTLGGDPGPDVLQLGPVPETALPSVYAGADLFLFPSLHEGFGLPALEAMASGTPVIASTAGSIPEVLDNAALLVGPDDSEAWEDAALHVLYDSTFRSTLIQRGLERARMFRWEYTVAGTLQVLAATAR